MKPMIISVGLACGLLMQACAQHQTLAWRTVDTQGTAAHYFANVKTGVLGLREGEGLFLKTELAANQALLSGDYELIDTREYGNDSLALTMDAQHNLPVLVQLNEQGAKIKETFEAPAFQVDALCLYNNDSNELFAFLLDGSGGGEMRWLLADNGQPVDAKIKDLRLPPGSEACSVDDQNAALYVLEEELGVWRYPAAVESAPQRQPVDLIQPWGNLQSQPVALRYQTEVGLLVLTPQEMLQYHGDSLVDRFSLEGFSEPVDVLVSAGNLMLLDEDQETLSTAKIALQSLVSKAPATLTKVAAVAETTPVDRAGDAADDPAIWVNKNDPSNSRILGTNKKWGLLVYSLEGEELQGIASGNLNNVDIRQDLELGGTTLDLAVASNRSDDTITAFTISNTGKVTELGRIATGLDDVYGICLYKAAAGELYTFINDKDGRYQQWRLDIHQGELKADLVRGFSLAGQPEGCVANDETAELFVGEEDHGLWLYSANPKASASGELLYGIGDILHDDVEGVALVNNELGHYLVVSSQGNDSYAVFNATAPYDYIGSFRVGLNAAALIDGASETDGLDLSGANFGAVFPKGIMVVQDGYNLLPSQAQNFKYLSWEDVLNALSN